MWSTWINHYTILPAFFIIGLILGWCLVRIAAISDARMNRDTNETIPNCHRAHEYIMMTDPSRPNWTAFVCRNCGHRSQKDN